MQQPTYVSIRSSTIIKIIAICALAWGIFFIRDFVLILLVAVVLASATELPVRFLARIGLPRFVSVLAMFLFLIGLIGVVSFIFIPPLADDIARFIQTLPKIIDSIRIFNYDLGFKDAAAVLSDLSRDISKGQILTIIKNTLFGSNGFFATTSLVVGSVFNLIITFVLAFYIALEEKGVQNFLKLFAPVSQEGYIENLWGRAQNKISLWMQGQLLLSALVALLVYVPMLLLSMPYAALIAVLAFLGELVPLVGLTLAMIPAFFIAWSHGGLMFLGIVALIFFIIAQLESHILYPRVMNKMVGVPSILIIISVIVGAKFAGIWGVILAVPMASIIKELIDDAQKRKVHGNQ